MCSWGSVGVRQCVVGGGGSVGVRQCVVGGLLVYVSV